MGGKAAGGMPNAGGIGFYGLSYDPFGKQGGAQAPQFPSRDFREMEARLNFIKDARGVGLFTAPPGFGKTYALRCFSNSLSPNLYQMAYICLATVSVTEFYRQFCAALGLEASGHKSAMFGAIQERLFVLFKEKRRPFILAVDEAHDMDPRALKDIKMIMNHDYDSLNCFTLLLIGEPHLNNIISKPIHEALMQRITIHYNFAGLSADETPQYIRHKISAAGGSAAILAESAAGAVHGFSNGNPRVIDNVMSDALGIGEQLGKKTIDTDVVLAAVECQSFL
jgi:type II secretory pathway predicted ATPase ExeA